MDSDEKHEVFMALFLEHQPKIYAYIRSLLHQRADANDVMQETATVLWKKFDEFEAGTHFDRWAFRTAYHQVRYFRQKKAREGKRLVFSDSVVDLLAAESEAMRESDDATREALERCVGKLGAEARNLLAIRYEPEATNRDVARRLGRSESVVSRKLARIYESLMKCISQQLKMEEARYGP
jgi:RNA polymerase sigma-70 factor (ECF subfamily)